MSTVFATVATPGPQGPPGPAGPAGVSPVWIVAAGVPANTLGSNGDMYLNNLTGDVYGPKAGGVWGPIVCNIKGPTGTPGYSPQYIVAAGPPSPATGANGDMYIDSTTSNVYGPKTGGSWGGVVCNIKGATGATGAQGPPGVAYTPKGAWAVGTTYAQGDMVSDLNVAYISLQSGNVGHTPASSPTWWESIGAGSQTPWLSNIDGATFNLSNAGRIGIGTTAPIWPLHVSSSGAAVGLFEGFGGAGGYIQGRSARSTSAAPTPPQLDDVLLGLNSAGWDTSAWGGSSQITIRAAETFSATGHGSYIAFYTIAPGTVALPERMRITATGNVGIGCIPANLLDVGTGAIGAVGGVQATVTSNVANSGISIGQSNANRGRMLWFYNATPASAYMTVESLGSNPLCLQTLGGNVGIGNTMTTLPDAAANNLQVLIGNTASATDVATELHIAGRATVSGNAVGLLGFPNYAISATDKRLAAITGNAVGGIDSGNLVFYTMSTGTLGERMRITSVGRIGIGTSTPNGNVEIIGTDLAPSSGGGTLLVAGPTSNSRLAFGYSATGDYGWLQAQHVGTGWASLLLNSAGGSVGIGTAAPSGQFNVHNSAGLTQTFLTCAAGYASYLEIGVPGQTVDINSDASGNMSIGCFGLVSGVIQMIRSGSVASTLVVTSGKIGIGKTPAYAVDAAGDVNCTGVYRINGTPISGGLSTQSVVTGSRALGSNYPNSTGKAMWVTVMLSLPNSGTSVTAYSDSGTVPGTAITVATNPVSSNGFQTVISLWVLPGNYYRLQNVGTGISVQTWVEYS
jgi:hypothetical protein